MIRLETSLLGHESCFTLVLDWMGWKPKGSFYFKFREHVLRQYDPKGYQFLKSVDGHRVALECSGGWLLFGIVLRLYGPIKKVKEYNDAN